MENKVAHCPSCQKPVLTDAQFVSPVKFFIRCPSCQKRLQVRVMVKIIAELMAQETSVKQENPVSAPLSLQGSDAKFEFPIPD